MNKKARKFLPEYFTQASAQGRRGVISVCTYPVPVLAMSYEQKTPTFLFLHKSGNKKNGANMMKAIMDKIFPIKEFMRSKKNDEKLEGNICMTLTFLFLVFGIIAMFIYLYYVIEPC